MILRVNDTSLVSRKFFATCCVIVEAPWGRRAGAVILRVQQTGARHACEIETAMLVEVLVLGREEGVDHRFGTAWIGRYKRRSRAYSATASRRWHAPASSRRLVILQLRIIRQVLRVMPHQAGDTGDPDQKQDRPRREQGSRKIAASVS